MTINLRVCTGRSCRERFSAYVVARLENDRTKFFPQEDIEIGTCLCRNRCEESPVIETDDGLYTRMNPIAASQLMSRLVAEAKSRIKQTKPSK
jgi:NADH:ubiquinone oxidoreductase subunit E